MTNLDKFARHITFTKEMDEERLRTVYRADFVLSAVIEIDHDAHHPDGMVLCADLSELLLNQFEEIAENQTKDEPPQTKHRSL